MNQEPEGKLIAIIGDADTVTGFLLAGIGERNATNSNFLVVDDKTAVDRVEAFFLELTGRNDIGIILINQHIANTIRATLKNYKQNIPTILEIPSKEHPYDPDSDTIMQRVSQYLGGNE